ncbi:MAG: superoxide dismutase [Clostridiales bacterium]|nr:superoxide dismutase [Clostridiales bacterium]
MYKQIELNYNFNALEPYIDELTMNTHYSKHHAAYTNNLNGAVDKLPHLRDLSIEDLLKDLTIISDEDIRNSIRNNGGGYYNHNLYFASMKPGGSNRPVGALAKQLDKDFGSYDNFKDKLSTAAANRFGSGWAWLSANENGDLQISSSPNQDNPIIESHGEWTPILGIDVWEHAYYLKYKNLRGDYIKNFFEVINWDIVEANYANVKSR